MTTTTATPNTLGRRLVFVLAAATGLTAANLYYAQPLLHTIAKHFGSSEGTTGLVVTASQIGYAAGLAFVVPVGDLVDRRRLITRALMAATVLLLVAAVAPTLWVLIGALGLVGLCSVVAQILVPMAAQMASADTRGKVVGTVMTGLLLGILLARTVSGLIAAAFGWRAVFVVAATLAAGLAVLLAAELPQESRRPGLSYGELMRSLVTLARQQPELRRTAVVGGLVFASFSAFWTTIAFRLSDPPFNYGDAAIGLLGLAGAAGALCASPAGRTSDRGWVRPARMISTATLAFSFAVLWFGRSSIVWIVVGVVLLDVGVQGTQVLNQSVIYGLVPSAQSRVNSVYMTTYFVGGAGGSAIAGAAYDSGGWGAVCLLGVCLAGAALLLAAPAKRAGPSELVASDS